MPASDLDPAPQSPLASDDERALARAVVYRFLSAAYRYPDDAATLQLRAFRPALHDAVEVLDEFGSDAPARFRDLETVPTGWLSEARQEGHIQVFGHAPEGPCPPYEGQYGDHEETLQMPHELSDLGAFYRAFGLKISERAHERVDSVAVECEYLSFLCEKQAYAERSGDPTLAGLCVDGQRKFLHEHFGRWVPALTRRMMKRAGAGFHFELARFTLAFVTDESRRLGVPLGSDHLRLRVAVEERDACFDCPKATGTGGPVTADPGFAV